MKHIQTESRMLSFNINNYATVTLTEFGAEIYNKRYDDMKQYVPTDYIFSNVDVKAGYVLKAQLWSLFQDFGPYISLGRENPFEGCIMMFDEEDFE